MTELNWTGERLVSDLNLGKGAVEHLHRYAFASEFIKDKTVLDIACGEGYGANLLAATAKFVTGIDISEAAIIHAESKYRLDNLKYLKASATKIPLKNNSVDVVVSFETIEHLIEQNEMVSECKRVLKEDGVFIISSPERENYRKVDPNNPYHLKELDFVEFQNLISSYFSRVCFYRQIYLVGSFIHGAPNQDKCIVEYSGSFDEIGKIDEEQYLYNLAVCSDSDNPVLLNRDSYFNGDFLHDKIRSLSYNTGYEEGMKVVRNSISYRFGQLFVKPLRIFKIRK